MESTLTSPLGAFTPVTTFVSGVDREGNFIEYGTRWYSYRTNAAITRGAGLMWVAATATTPLSVTHMTTAASLRLFAGVAMEAASGAGKIIRVCVGGHCLVNMNAQTSAFGEYLVVPATNAGELTRASTALDATTVAGSVLGTVLGVKDATTLLAHAYIHQI